MFCQIVTVAKGKDGTGGEVVPVCGKRL